MADRPKAAKPKANLNVLRPDGTYILIGGTGGLGRRLAKWMSSKGAGHIVLVSRSASVNEKTQQLIEQLRPSGTRVILCPCDASNKISVEKLVKEDLKDLPPIRGVVHGAMVLRVITIDCSYCEIGADPIIQDMLFERMTLEDFHAVTACKVEGALNLHQALAASPLDFFVALSSIAGVVGNRGQAAYAAANVFLDEFMHFRRSQNLPGASISLAAVSNVGYLADGGEARREEVLKNIGDQMIDESEVLALFAAAVTGKMDQSCQGHCIAGLNAPDEETFWLKDGKFGIFYEKFRSQSAVVQQDGSAVALSKVLRTAASKEEASQALYGALSAKIAGLLVIPIDAIEPTHTLKSFGLDSLVAIELRSWIARETEVNVQILELLSSGSIISLVDLILKKMGISR